MRRSIFWVILIAAVLLPSCQGKTKNVPGITITPMSRDSRQEFVRYQNRFAEGNGIVYFENSSSIVGEKADLVLYCDLDSGISGPLCGKPECTHDHPDCSAYIGYYSEKDSIMPDGLFLYDGRLYYTVMHTVEKEGEGLYLYSMAADGSGHRTEMKLGDFREDPFPNQNTKSLMHRGYFFACGGAPYVRDGEWISREMLLRWSLKTGEKQVLFEWEDPLPGRMSYSYMQAYQDRLYYLITIPETDTENGEKRYEIQIYEAELAALQMEKRYEGSVGFEIREMRVADGGIYFSDSVGKVYYYSFSGGIPEFLFSVPEQGEETERVYFSDGIVYGFTRNAQGEQYLTVKDTEGGGLLHHKIREKVSDGSSIRLNLGNDSENIYVYYSALSDAPDYRHKLTAYRIRDGEEKVLWMKK